MGPIGVPTTRQASCGLAIVTTVAAVGLSLKQGSSVQRDRDGHSDISLRVANGAAIIERLMMFLTAACDQGTPVRLCTPLALSARATPRSVVTPLACISLMIGMMFAAKRSALALLAAVPSACAVELFCTLSLCCPAERASDPHHRLRVLRVPSLLTRRRRLRPRKGG